MKLIRPFNALRPLKELAQKVAAPPYDVLNRREAFQMAKGNEYSFLRINKPEIDVFPAMDPYDPKVYQKGAANLQKFIDKGIMLRDEKPTFYVYRQIMGAHQQTGLVAVASVDAYEANLIKKHEFTRPDKEDDRVNHIDALSAQVGPVFLTYRAQDAIDALIDQVCHASPEYDFTSDDGNQHILWVISDSKMVAQLQEQFDKIDCLYVADGHHRSAAAARVRDMRRKANPGHTGQESYNWFSSVIFPHNQMQILDYNRVVKDLNGLSEDEFLRAIQAFFNVHESLNSQTAKPLAENHFGMYLASGAGSDNTGSDNTEADNTGVDKPAGGKWYTLVPIDRTWPEDDPVRSLDVSILQNNLLSRTLGIEDPRRDKRIDFVGGIRGLKELEKRVDSGEWAVAFALHPTSIESLMAIADANEVMPPKSTWFEPKLKSGLFVHILD